MSTPEQRSRNFLLAIVSLVVVASSLASFFYLWKIVPAMAQIYAAGGEHLSLVTRAYVAAANGVARLAPVLLLLAVAGWVFRRRLPQQSLKLLQWILGPLVVVGLAGTLAAFLVGAHELVIAYEKTTWSTAASRAQMRLADQLLERDYDSAQMTLEQMRSDVVPRQPGLSVFVSLLLAEVSARQGKVKDAEAFYEEALEATESRLASGQHRWPLDEDPRIWRELIEERRTRVTVDAEPEPREARSAGR